MGFAVDSTASLTQALQEWDEAPWQRPCDPVRILLDSETVPPVSCYLALEDGKEGDLAVEWQVRDEANNAVVQEGRGKGQGFPLWMSVSLMVDGMCVSKYLPRVVSRSGTTI